MPEYRWNTSEAAAGYDQFAQHVHPYYTEIQDAILDGADKMPPQKNKVTREEITEIIKYLRYSQQAADLVVEEDSDEEIEEEDLQEG